MIALHTVLQLLLNLLGISHIAFSRFGELLVSLGMLHSKDNIDSNIYIQ